MCAMKAIKKTVVCTCQKHMPTHLQEAYATMCVHARLSHYTCCPYDTYSCYTQYEYRCNEARYLPK